MSLMKKNRPLIVACMPAFNEKKTIAKVILLAQRVFKERFLKLFVKNR